MSETIDNGPVKAFYAAMAKAQGKIEGALKDADNPYFNSKYADLGSAWAACREPLTSNGLAVLQFPDYDPATKCVTVETILTHSEGYEKSFSLNVPVSKVDAQGIGSAITYARRYALMAAVGIAPEDDDGNAAVAQDAGHTTKPSTKKNGNATNFLSKNDKGRDLYAELQADIDGADSADALQVWSTSRKADIDTLPDDWRKNLRSRYADKLNELKFGKELTHAD